MNLKQTISFQKSLFFLSLLAMSSFNVFGQNSSQKIKQLSKKIKTTTGKEKVKILTKLAVLEEKEKLRTQSFKHLNQALQLSQQENYLKEEANIYLLFGQYEGSVDTARALVHFQKSMAIFQQQKDSLSLADTYLYVGKMYDNTNDYPKALNAQLQSLKIRKALRDESLDIGLFNTAVAYNNVKNYSKANQLFQEALALFRRQQKKKYITSTLMALGALQILIDKPFEAFEYLREAEAMAKELDLTDKSEIELLRAKIHLQGHDYSQAIFHAKKALKQANSSHSLAQMQKSNFLLYRIYKEKGAIAPALGYHEKNLALQDSLHQQELEIIQQLYAAEKEEFHSDYLQKTKIMQVLVLEENKVNQRNLIIFAVIVAIIGVLFLIGVSIFNKRASLLLEKEKAILGLKSEKHHLEQETKSKEKEIKVQRQRIQLLLEEKKKTGKPKKEEKFQNEDIQNVNNANERFFAIIAHELRNPITSFHDLSSQILNYLELGETDKLTSLFGETQKGITALNLLLDNLLNFATLQSGSFSNKPQHLKIKEIATETSALFEKSIATKNLNIKVSVNANLKAKVDQNAIHIIVRNLISNAVKFSNEGGVITIKAKKENNFVKVSISDTGIGIPKNQLENVFDLKPQKTSKGTQDESGNGLGLTLAKEFIAHSGGKIWAESQVGQGSTFHFTLPH